MIRAGVIFALSAVGSAGLAGDKPVLPVRSVYIEDMPVFSGTGQPENAGAPAQVATALPGAAPATDGSEAELRALLSRLEAEKAARGLTETR